MRPGFASPWRLDASVDRYRRALLGAVLRRGNGWVLLVRPLYPCHVAKRFREFYEPK